jgi:hypothetical protein
MSRDRDPIGDMLLWAGLGPLVLTVLALLLVLAALGCGLAWDCIGMVCQ